MAVEETSERKSPLRQCRDDLMAVTKARLSFLVVLTACFGYVLATKGQGTFSGKTLFHVFLGTALSAAGSAVFNQLMEIDSDSRMQRTLDRPLPANRMPRAVAFIFGWLLCAFGLIHLGLMVNVTASVLAGLTLLTYLFIYTPMKRVSSANTLVGAVSGAIPPLIGWAGGGQPLLSAGAVFLFALLFFWQLPHFAAINWMYREEYIRGGFKMWSNGDESGRRTAKIALFYAVCLTLLGILFPLVTSAMQGWGALCGGLLGAVTVWLAWKFLKNGERGAARSLFYFTLLYLPLMMIASYLAWNGVRV